MGEEKTPILFVHIPKTGGISFVRALSDLWPGQIVDLYAATAADPQPVRQFLASPAAREIQLYAGHFSWGLHRWLPVERYYYVSLMREPVARICSLYRHEAMFRSRIRAAMQAEGKCSEEAIRELLCPGAFPDFHQEFAGWMAGDGGWDAFLDCPSAELDNAMVRRFSGYGVRPGRCPLECLAQAQENIRNQFAVVGILEQYSRTLELLQTVFELPLLAVRHDNASSGEKNRGNHLPAEPPDTRALGRIRNRNRLDIALYAWVQQRFEQQCAQPRRRVMPVTTRGGDGEENNPLWKSVGTLGLSPIAVGSNAASPRWAKGVRPTQSVA